MESNEEFKQEKQNERRSVIINQSTSIEDHCAIAVDEEVDIAAESYYV